MTNAKTRIPLIWLIGIGSFLHFLQLSGQNLQPGDLAVLGVNAVNFACSGLPTEDHISFVCFKDIGAGMVIDMTDNGWERVNPGFFGNSEGTLRMTFNTAISKGEVITISLVNSPETYTCVSHPGGINFANINSPPGFAMNMNAGGDQLFFMQGGTWDPGTPNGHNASYTGGNILFGFSTSDWNVSSGTSQESKLHPDVIPCYHMEPTTGQTDFLKYTGPMTPATQLSWINRIKDPANWTAFADCNAYNSAPPNYPQPVTLPILPSGMSISCAGNCSGCAPLSAVLSFSLPATGGPFIVVYTDGVQEFTLNNAMNGSTVNVTVNTNTTYSLVSVADLQGCPVYSNFEGEAVLSITTPPVLAGVSSNSPVCQGETIMLTAPTIPGGLYEWTGPDGFISLQQNPIITNAQPSMSGTYSLTVSVNGCMSQPATTNLTVLPGPVAYPTALSECGANGAATFNLVGANGIVNGNTGLPVSWYFDPLGMNPIFNPASFTSSSTTVFAQVTNSSNCTSEFVPVTLNVIAPITPVITGVPGVVCENEPPLVLPTTQSGINGIWSGQGVSANTFNPAGLNGVIPLSFWPEPMACAEPTTFYITVQAPVVPTITGVPDSLCQDDNPIALPVLQSGISGTWSGAGVSANSFDPEGLSGNLTLTFTPDPGQCAGNVTTVIVVRVLITPVISGLPTSLCEDEDPVALPLVLSGISGNWSGNGVVANHFNPAGQSGSVTLTFTPVPGQCAGAVSAAVQVNELATPQLDTASICETANPLNLNALNDPVFPAGTWSGPGVTGNSFDPDGLSGSITLTFIAAAACTNPATTTISVNEPALPQLGTAAICQNDNPLDLSTLTDPAYPDGTWAGTGVSGNHFNPAGQNGSITLTFTPSAGCTQPNNTTVTVNGLPGFSGLQEECNQATQTYTVSFDIIGGTAPYTVNGNPLAGTVFSSGDIASGTAYSFAIDDANGCGPVMVTGSANCSCATAAGTMSQTGAPFIFCYSSDSFSVSHNGDEVLEADDLLQFVLHDNAGSALGNLILISNSPTFSTPPGLVPGQLYYVSALAGNDDGSGQVDLNDPCLSVSQGVPVQFYEPSVQLTDDQTICGNDCADVAFQLTGAAPYQLEVMAFMSGLPVLSIPLTNIDSGFVMSFCPGDYGISSGVVSIEIASVTDANNCTAHFNPPVSTGIVVQPVAASLLSTALCQGESVVVNGNVYDENNPVGTEVFPSGSYLGCDSIVSVNLTYFPPAVLNLNQTLCAGSSLIINGTLYDENHASGTEILPNAGVNGCDSIIYVNLVFESAIVHDLTPTLCPGESLVVNGTVYDQAHPAGVENYPGGSYLGCDSIVNVHLTFYPPAVFNLNQVLCAGESLVVNGTVYDAGHPFGTEILPNASVNGCDSTVFIGLTFHPLGVNNLFETLCPGESLVINGTVYDQAHPAGTEVFQGGSHLGCDSVVNVSLAFFDSAVFNFTTTLCPGESLIINGTVYDEAHPLGTEVFPSASANGCDSTVLIVLNFLPPANGNFSQTLCHGESLSVYGTVFNQNNPAGQVVIPNGSITGCDSILTVSLMFFPEVVDTMELQLCKGGSIMVNGTVYDEAHPTGTEILADAAANGCDSMVVVLLSFGDKVVVSFNPLLCAGDSVFINGTLYNSDNPFGTETFPGGSYLGCDSTVNISLGFYPISLSQIISTLPADGSIVVNGTVYDRQNPQGVEVIAGGSYTGCDSTIIIHLTFTGAIEAQASVNSPLCRLGDDGSIVVESIIGGTPPYVLALNGGNSAPVVSFPVVFSDLDAGFHTLTIIDAVGSIVQQELFMPDAPQLTIDPGGDLTLQLGSSTELSVTMNFTAVSWSWSPPDYLSCTDCPTPVAALPQEDITYTLVATDANGCTATGKINLTVEKIRRVYVPNAISPNNDGVNDELTVFAGSQVAIVRTFRVFNRWGGLLFERSDFPPNDLQLGWDGKYKGKDVSVGAYVWFAEVEFLDGHREVFEGGVTVVR